MISVLRRTSSIAVSVAAILGCASSAVAQAPLVETQIAHEKRQTLMAAYDGWVAWSSYDEAKQAWRLVGRAPGSSVTKRFAVATRKLPFDLDLGPDANARPAAVYSRCRQESRSWGPGLESGAHRRSRDCRIVKLDLKSGRESAFYRRGGVSLIFPTLWRNRLAYVVRRKPDDLRLELRVRRHGRTVTTELGEAPAQSAEIASDGPTHLDLYGKNLVFAWSTSKGRYRCPGSSVVPDDRSGGHYVVTRVYLQRANQQRQLLDKGCDDSADTGAIAVADAPAISDGFITWYRLIRTGTAADPGNRLLRRSLRTGKTTSRPISSPYLSIATDGRTIYAQADLSRVVRVRWPG